MALKDWKKSKHDKRWNVAKWIKIGTNKSIVIAKLDTMGYQLHTGNAYYVWYDTVQSIKQAYEQAKSYMRSH